MLVEAKLLHSLNIESCILVFSVCFGHHSQNNCLSCYQYVVIISIVIMIIGFAKMPIIINSIPPYSPVPYGKFKAV